MHTKARMKNQTRRSMPAILRALAEATGSAAVEAYHVAIADAATNPRMNFGNRCHNAPSPIVAPGARSTR
jgi:hypothetical protein